jgi:hypothetical protein
MWDLWWTKWHWDRFFPEYFGFPLLILFHRCSITRKKEKNLFIFITGLHNKPQGCDASVACAAEPFTKKKTFKPIGYFMYHQVYDLKILHSVHGFYLCFWNSYYKKDFTLLVLHIFDYSTQLKVVLNNIKQCTFV